MYVKLFAGHYTRSWAETKVEQEGLAWVLLALRKRERGFTEWLFLDETGRPSGEVEHPLADLGKVQSRIEQDLFCWWDRPTTG